jgi:hypothetical protein
VIDGHIYVVVKDGVLCAVEHFSSTTTRQLAYCQHISQQTVVRVLHDKPLSIPHYVLALHPPMDRNIQKVFFERLLQQDTGSPTFFS